MEWVAFFFRGAYWLLAGWRGNCRARDAPTTTPRCIRNDQRPSGWPTPKFIAPSPSSQNRPLTIAFGLVSTPPETSQQLPCLRVKGKVVKVKNKDIRLRPVLIKLRSQQSQGTIYHPEAQLKLATTSATTLLDQSFPSEVSARKGVGRSSTIARFLVPVLCTSHHRMNSTKFLGPKWCDDENA